MKLRSSRVLLGSMLISMGLSACGGKDGSDKDEQNRDEPTDNALPQTENQPSATNPASGGSAAPSVGPASGGSAAVFQLSEGTAAKNRSFYVKVEWQDKIVANRHLSAKLTFVDGTGQVPTSVSNVSFEPHMPSMGHGTAMDDQTIVPSPTQPNVFLVKGAYLIMGGQWEVKIGATVNGVVDMAAVPFKAR